MTDMLFSPEQVSILWFLGAAGKAQDLEHVWKSTAISRLFDEDRMAKEKDQEGDTEAHSRDDIAQLKADVLLDVSHTAQRQDGT